MFKHLGVLMVLVVFPLTPSWNLIVIETNISDLKAEVLIVSLIELKIPVNIGILLYEKSVELDYDYADLLAQVFVESTFNTDAKSYAGAVGLMQIMWSANDHVNVLANADYNRFDIDDNIEIGIYYMKFLERHYGYSKEQAYRRYNGGRKWRSIPETLYYAKRVDRASDIIEAVLQYNFSNVKVKDIILVEVEVETDRVQKDTIVIILDVMIIVALSMCIILLSLILLGLVKYKVAK